MTIELASIADWALKVLIIILAFIASILLFSNVIYPILDKYLYH